LWRDKVATQGLAQSAKLVKEAGLKVSSLCRGGMFPAATETERKKRIEDNLRAIDECVALGTDTLVFVCGGLHSKDIAGARQMVYDGMAAITPYALEHGIKLGIEPLHPMYAADRNVIVTLEQANDFVLKLNGQFSQRAVGVVIDVFHVWWDPNIYQEIIRAKGHIFGFHVCDWITPLPDVLKARGMMGDGWIEIRKLREAVEAAGYAGPIECEIFNQVIWDQDGQQTLKTMKQRFLEVC
jgi:sugar phosphate isomerase/epimerase